MALIDNGYRAIMLLVILTVLVSLASASEWDYEFNKTGESVSTYQYTLEGIRYTLIEYTNSNSLEKTYVAIQNEPVEDASDISSLITQHIMKENLGYFEITKTPLSLEEFAGCETIESLEELEFIEGGLVDSAEIETAKEIKEAWKRKQALNIGRILVRTGKGLTVTGVVFEIVSYACANEGPLTQALGTGFETNTLLKNVHEGEFYYSQPGMLRANLKTIEEFDAKDGNLFSEIKLGRYFTYEVIKSPLDQAFEEYVADPIADSIRAVGEGIKELDVLELIISDSDVDAGVNKIATGLENWEAKYDTPLLDILTTYMHSTNVELKKMSIVKAIDTGNKEGELSVSRIETKLSEAEIKYNAVKSANWFANENVTNYLLQAEDFLEKTKPNSALKELKKASQIIENGTGPLRWFILILAVVLLIHRKKIKQQIKSLSRKVSSKIRDKLER